MCIKRKCKYCGEIFTHPNIARTVCDKQECKNRSRGRIRKHDLVCVTCGKLIPIGSCRHKYCSDECSEIGHKEIVKSYNGIHTRTRIGCFMDVKAEVIYKPVGEVNV
jgi:hypothetical protein